MTSSFTLAVTTGFASPQPGFTRAISDLLLSVPPFLGAVWEIGADLLLLNAALLLVACAVRRRWAILRDLAFAAGAALLVTLVLARLLDGVWPDELGRALLRAQPPARYPWTRLAVPVAVIVAAAPHVVLPVRRFGRWMIAVGAVAGVALGATTVLGSVAALCAGAIAAALTHLIFGSTAGRPSLSAVRAALDELGVTAEQLAVADQQRAGVFVVTAVGAGLGREPAADLQPIHVKVYGRDAHGAALVSALWRTAWYREPAPPTGFGRLQQVEHEAFLTLLARQSGVVTDTVVTAGATEADDALLVLRPIGRPVVVGDTDLVGSDDARVVGRDLWTLVDTLHTAGIVHGQVDVEHLIIDDGRLGITDFRTARVAPTPLQLRTDEVQALVTEVVLLGEEPALANAVRARGAAGIAAMLPVLQVPTLTTAQRQLVKDRGLDLDALRTRAADLAGIEAPAQQKLYRFTVGSIVRVALPAVALFALVAALAGLDFEALGREVRGATWWLILVGALLAQLPRVFQAISTLGAAPVPLPLGPVYALQLAVSYVNLAIPTAAARVAINIRFFQRHGVPPGAAMASGALDGFSGFIVQALLLVVLLVATPLSLDLNLAAPSAGSAARFGLIALAIGVTAFVVVTAVARLRRFVVQWAKQLVTEAVGVFRGLRSPRRLAMLFGGNLAAEVTFAMALGTFARAFGVHVGIGELLLIVISVSLLAGLLPVPGGVGVTEGGLIYGLVTAGVDESIAFAAVILYRLATFYLPPIWGYVALKWLERHRHI